MHVVERPGRALRISGTVSERLTQGHPFARSVMAVEPLAAREVTLLTYDTGQSTHARNAGLRVKKLVRPAQSEPASTAQP
jgi:hypothetical protein